MKGKRIVRLVAIGSNFRNHYTSFWKGQVILSTRSLQNELVAAYNELRNELSKEKFGKNFADLDEDQQNAIQDVYPQKISEAEPKNYGGGKK